MNTIPVIIVSIFGRGHDLAASLKTQGLEVMLVDLSPLMGKWSVEEIEGPFGLLKNDKLSALQQQRLTEDDSMLEIEKGFTFWLGQQLLEMKSPLTPVLNERLHLDLNSVGALVKNVKKANLLHRFFNSFSRSQYFGFDQQPKDTPTHPNWGQSFLIRKATRQGLERSFAWLESLGVKVIKESKLVDLALKGSATVTAIELAAPTAGLFSAEKFIWCLSSEETKFISEKCFQKLFDGKLKSSEWCWLKYRVQVGECPERDALPSHWGYLKDPDAPWSHENLLLIQGTSSPEFFDVWQRLPTVQRFNREYLVARGEDLLEALGKFILPEKISIHTYPQEYSYTYLDLGAPRFPVFGGSPKQTSMSNVYFSSPEVWNFYGWDQILLSHQSIEAELMKWWQLKLAKLAKLEKNKELVN